MRLKCEREGTETRLGPEEETQSWTVLADNIHIHIYIYIYKYTHTVPKNFVSHGVRLSEMKREEQEIGEKN